MMLSLAPRFRHLALSASLGVASALSAVGAALAGEEASASSPETVTVEITVSGPAGPYPYGHAEYRATVYEGALADAPPEIANLGVQSEMLPAMALPHSLKVEIPADRLTKSVRPQVSVVIAIARRVAFISDAPFPLDPSGPTHVVVKALP